MKSNLIFFFTTISTINHTVRGLCESAWIKKPIIFREQMHSTKKYIYFECYTDSAVNI